MTYNFQRFFLLILIGLLCFNGCASDKKKVESYLSQAQTYFDSEEYPKAIIQLKNAIQIDGKSVKAYTLLSKAYLKTQQPKEAFGVFLRLEQLEPDNIDHKLQAASFFLLGKNYEEAQKRIDAVLEKDPRNIQALYLHAGILALQKKDMATIESVYKKILEIDPGQAKAHQLLAGLYGVQKNFDEAESNLKQALELEPENISLYQSMFGFYLAKRQLDDAQNVLETLVAQRPDDQQPLILLANFHEKKGEIETAEALYRKAIEKDPDNASGYMMLAAMFRRQNRIEAAEEQIKNALEKNPDNVAVKNAYADFLFSSQNTDKALEIVNGILAERPDYPASKLLKGRILAAKKQYEPARDLFLELLKEEPDSPGINFLLGSLFFDQKDYLQAAPYLSKTVEKQPRHIPALMMLANIHFSDKDLTLARDNVNKILRLQPDHFNANILLGNIEMASGNPDIAARIFKQMISAFPENPVSYYRMGVVQFQLKKDADAFKMFEKALDINPNLMDVFTSMIGAYAARKQFSTALDKCDARLSKADENPVIRSIIFNLKGNLLTAMGKMTEAKDAYQKSINHNPAYITPYLTLAKISTSENDPDTAVQLYKTLIKNRPEQAAPHSMLGTIYEQQGKYDLARTRYETALEINPDYLPAINNLAFLYADQGIELNKALELARRAKEKLGSLPAVTDTLGWVYYKKELYDSALIEFENCVEKEPDNPVFNFHLGMTYNKLGRYNKAEEALKKALALKKDFKGADEAQKTLDLL